MFSNVVSRHILHFRDIVLLESCAGADCDRYKLKKITQHEPKVEPICPKQPINSNIGFLYMKNLE